LELLEVLFLFCFVNRLELIKSLIMGILLLFLNAFFLNKMIKVRRSSLTISVPILFLSAFIPKTGFLIENLVVAAKWVPCTLSNGTLLS